MGDFVQYPGNKSRDSRKSVLLETNLQIILAVTFLSVMGVSSITPALPRIASELDIPKGSIGIFVAAFSIPSVIMAPIIGVLSDRFGRKKFLVASLLLFGVAGGACVFAGSLNTLVFLRFVQGLGAAGLSTLNVTIIGDIFDGKERTEALGYNASAIAIGLGLFPVIGGSLAMVGWKYPFALPFAAVLVGVWAIFSLNNPERQSSKSMKDYVSSSLANLMKAEVMGTFAVGLITFIILYGSFFTYFPVLMAENFEASSMVTGVTMAIMSTAAVLTATQLSRIVERVEEHNLIKIAAGFYGVSLLAMPFVTDPWTYIIPLAVFGVAHGINIPCIQTLVVRFAPDDNRAVFMSANNMVFRLGQTLGPLVMGLAYSLWEIDAVFFTGTILCFVILIFALLITRNADL